MAGEPSCNRDNHVAEQELIAQFLAARTEEAFCALFEAVCVRVRRYFLLRGLDAATAEDLTQNVFVKVYRQAGELREAAAFYGWLFAIARNELLSYWRREQPRQMRTESLSEQTPQSLQIEPEATATLRMMDLLNALEPPERDLVVLRFVEGLSYEELAAALKLPLGTIKWRIFNARKKLAHVVGTPATDKTRPKMN
jgi:RNA polymerase sigma-70 factor, ECF subfamily